MQCPECQSIGPDSMNYCGEYCSFPLHARLVPASEPTIGDLKKLYPLGDAQIISRDNSASPTFDKAVAKYFGENPHGFAARAM